MSALALRQTTPAPLPLLLNRAALTSALDALRQCDDACDRAGGDTVGSYGLMACIEALTECQRHCATTARFLVEFFTVELPFLRNQLCACAEICDRCAKECGRYRDFENWSECADANRECAEICRYLLHVLPTAAQSLRW